MKRTLSKEVEKNIGKVVSMFGWVAKRRDHGKIIFIDFRDRWGLTQIVFDEKSFIQLEKLTNEDVAEIKGLVKKRPENMVNPKIISGKVEVHAQELTIISKSQNPPFEIDETEKINEELRMKYRYLDLRSERMKNNIVLRGRVIKFIRDYLESKDFIEIETPLLTKSTPEGARDYLVPSRLQPGKFYALPQSPQQFKQLLMVAGFERYFQIAKCLRDEDPRGDRQPEHTQLDLEMSFVSQEEAMALNENLAIDIINKFQSKRKIAQIPFPILSYDEAIKKYKTDRPDLKKNKDELAFCWVKDFPFFEKDKEGKWTFTHNPFSAPMPEDENQLLNGKIEEVKTSQYDLVLNGQEIAGGSIRSHNPKILAKVFEILGYSQKETQEKFGHMLTAFEYGVPPHGGIAWGLDRLIAILANQLSIREVIAFPKTGDGRDLMMGAPAEVDLNQLKELKINIDKTAEGNEK